MHVPRELSSRGRNNSIGMCNSNGSAEVAFTPCSQSHGPRREVGSHNVILSPTGVNTGVRSTGTCVEHVRKLHERVFFGILVPLTAVNASTRLRHVECSYRWYLPSRLTYSVRSGSNECTCSRLQFAEHTRRALTGRE